jgi:hypothetical protein
MLEVECLAGDAAFLYGEIIAFEGEIVTVFLGDTALRGFNIEVE